MSVYRSKVVPGVSQKPQVTVEAHSPPPLPTPRVMPSSPNMIPAFTFTPDEVTSTGSVVSNNVQNGSLKRSRTSDSVKHRDSKAITVLKNQRKYHRPVQNEPLRFGNQSYRKNQKPTIPQQTKRSPVSKVGRSSTLTNMVKKPVKLQKRPHTSRDDSRKTDSILSMYINNEYPPYNPSDFALEQREDESDSAQNRNIQKTVPKTRSDKQDLLKKIREELSLWAAGSSTQNKNSCPEQWTSAAPESTYLYRPHAQSLLYSKMHFGTNVFFIFSNIEVICI